MEQCKYGCRLIADNSTGSHVKAKIIYRVSTGNYIKSIGEPGEITLTAIGEGLQ